SGLIHTCRGLTRSPLLSESARSALSTLFPYTTLFRSELEQEGLPDNVSAYIEPKEIDITIESRATREFGIDIDLVNLDKINIDRSEEHTSELQSRFDLVCRLLLEKINKFKSIRTDYWP